MKDLPDSEGVWWPEALTFPILFEEHDGVLLGWDGRYWLPATEWVATRWLKIEKPDFSKAE